MDCPKCKTPDAYQGFNYRDGQVDCLNKRCSNYSAEHEKKMAKTSTSTSPRARTVIFNPTTYEEFEEDLAKPHLKGSGKLQSGRAIAAQADAEAEEWDKMWDAIFSHAQMIYRQTAQQLPDLLAPNLNLVVRRGAHAIDLLNPARKQIMYSNQQVVDIHLGTGSKVLFQGWKYSAVPGQYTAGEIEYHYRVALGTAKRDLWKNLP
jgi:hypothetical protein